ncbi:MAG TPA: AAA family ATPase [Chloroflexota bacterium]|jgi:DNA-binding CsgD family transcriptional regulator
MNLLERSDVTAAIDRALDSARRGQGTTLGIVAEAGLGKTSLIDYACDKVGGTWRVARARGHEMESSIAYGLVMHALSQLTPRGGAGPLADTLDGTPAERRAARFQTALKGLERTTDSPILLAFDDVHWSDADSVGLIAYLCRRIRSLPVAVLLALRPWPAEAGLMAADLVHDDHATIQTLQPLGWQSAAEIIAAQTTRPVDSHLAKRAWELCAGNPLLLQQVAQAVALGDDVPAPGESAPRQLADEVLLRRFAGLPGAGLRYVQAASVLGDTFHPEIAAKLAQLSPEEVEAALSGVLRSGLLRADADGRHLEFAHPLFAQALRDDLAPPERARLHREAFSILLAAGRRALAAEHALAGAMLGNPRAIAVLEKVGRIEFEAGAFRTATRLLQAAVETAGDTASFDLLVATGNALVAVGRPADAISVLEQALRHFDIEPAARARTLRLLGRALFVTRQHKQASVRFDEAARFSAAWQCTGARVEALLDHALACWVSKGPAAALPLCHQALEVADDRDRVLRTRALSAFGFFRFVCGDPSGLETARATARLVLQDNGSLREDLAWAWGAVINFALGASYAELFDEAEAVFRGSLEVAERVGATEALVTLELGYATALGRQGRLHAALERVERARRAASDIAVPRPFLALAHATVLFALGRAPEAEVWLARAEALAQPDEQLAMLRLWHLQAQRHLAEGRHVEAQQLHLRLEQTAEQLGLAEPCVVPWMRSAIAAHLACHAVDDAERVVDRLESLVTPRLPCRSPRLVAMLGHAQIAAARGDHCSASEHFESAVLLSADVAMPLVRADALLTYGSYVRRRGEAGKARTLLGQAVAIAESCEAQPLAQRARMELAAAGGRRRRQLETEGLTSQELRVAQLACTGLSNREIADQVVASVRTVETHLQHVYQKLSINSRRQLIAMAAAGELPAVAPNAR